MTNIGVLEIDLTRPQYSRGRVKINTGQNNQEEKIIEIEGYERLKPAFSGDIVEIKQIAPIQSTTSLSDASLGSETGHIVSSSTNHAILGSETGHIVKIVSRAKSHRLSGILYLNSRVVYGANKRGIPYFLFKPSDPTYPNCIVTSRLKLQMQKRQGKVENQYVVVDFNFSDGSNFWNGKFPKASLVKVLGRVGDLEVEYNQILHRWKLDQSSFNKLLRQDAVKEQIARDLDTVCANSSTISNSLPDSVQNVEDLTKKNVFSIDPEGCEDIDDAMHVIDHGNQIEVGIHIADVSSWITEGSILDLEARVRMTTIYPPNGRVDMFPEAYSTKVCSLVEGEERLALSTILVFTPTGELRRDRIRFVQSRIKSRAALSYEEAEMFLRKKRSTQKNKGREEELVKTIEKDLEILAYISKTHDPHKIVEYFMVLVNTIVAEKLYEVCPEKLILRVHQGKKAETARMFQEKTGSAEMDKKLSEHLRIISMNSAEYLPIQQLDDGDKTVQHYGLGLKYYTHFTSPIRRYVDLINHRLVKKFLVDGIANDTSTINCTSTTNDTSNNCTVSIISNIENTEFNLEEFCSRLNDLQKRNNVAERQFKLLEIISQLEKRWEQMEEIITTGYVTEISEVPFITVYFPEFDFSKKIRLFHHKLDSLNNSATQSEVKLLQKLKIKIVPNLQGETLAKKIKIQFLDNI